jgi:hypothetical protein
MTLKHLGVTVLVVLTMSRSQSARCTPLSAALASAGGSGAR